MLLSPAYYSYHKIPPFLSHFLPCISCFQTPDYLLFPDYMQIAYCFLSVCCFLSSFLTVASHSHCAVAFSLPHLFHFSFDSSFNIQFKRYLLQAAIDDLCAPNRGNEPLLNIFRMSCTLIITNYNWHLPQNHRF